MLYYQEYRPDTNISTKTYPDKETESMAEHETRQQSKCHLSDSE